MIRVIERPLIDGQEFGTTEDVLPLSVGLDTECETLLPNEEIFPLSGATVGKDNDGTRTAWTAWTALTASTVDIGNVTEGSRRMAVDGRFQPILLCEG